MLCTAGLAKGSASVDPCRDQREEEAGLWEGLAGNFFEKQAAFSHLFTDSSLSPKGLPTYASDVAPDLLGVQFDGKNFSVV